MKKLTKDQMMNLNGGKAKCIYTYIALPYMVLLGMGLPQSFQDSFYGSVSDCWD